MKPNSKQSIAVFQDVIRMIPHGEIWFCTTCKHSFAVEISDADFTPISCPYCGIQFNSFK